MSQPRSAEPIGALRARRTWRALRPAAALVAAWIFAASPAHAAPHRIPAPTGEPTQASIDEARARFSTGNRAVDAGRWADALADFERSYSLSGVPAALFNVATTLRALGRHVEARDAFDQLLASHPKIDPGEREKARSLRAEEQARIATLKLEDVPASASVSLDGKRIEDDAARPLRVEVDAGRHDVRIERPQYKPFAWKGDLAEGDTRTLHVELVVEPAAVAIPPTPIAPESSGGVLHSPIFWSIVGIVVVGAGATGIWWGVKGRDQRLDPSSPNVVHL